MAAKLIRLTHKIAIQLHLVAESCTICGSCSRRPVRKLLDTPSHAQPITGSSISLSYATKFFLMDPELVARIIPLRYKYFTPAFFFTYA
jgi:hypothetical protein